MASMSASATAVHHVSAEHHESTKTANILDHLPQNLTSAMGLRRPHQPPLLPCPSLTTAEGSLEDKADAGGIDSGYASAAGTPESKTVENSQVAITSDIQRRFFPRKILRLRQFDLDLPLTTQQRFSDLTELFGEPLYQYLHKTKLKYNVISMKLKVLGESEQTAGPWIIILCDAVILKKVKQFFQQQWVKAEYQPSDAGMNLPRFDIHYLDRAPKQQAASILADVYEDFLSTDSTHSKTLCGRAIKVIQDDRSRTATLGGIIKVVTSDRITQFYGLTVGHIISDKGLKGDETKMDYTDVEYMEEGEDENMDGDESESLFEDEIQLELDFEDNPDIPWRWQNILKVTGCTENSNTEAGWDSGLQPKLGHATVSSSGTDRGNLDWALVTLDNLTHYLPNMIMSGPGWSGLANTYQTLCSSSRSVVLLSRSYKFGSLSALKSSVMLAPGQSFVQVYNVKLSDRSGLQPGDCGSWVVDSETYEVYGHVIASDIFGEAYVVPISATLESIKIELTAIMVSLPTVDEVQEWQRQYWINPNEISTQDSSLFGSNTSRLGVGTVSDTFPQDQNIPAFGEDQSFDMFDWPMFSVDQNFGMDQPPTPSYPGFTTYDWEPFMIAPAKSPLHSEYSLPDSGYSSMQTSPTPAQILDHPDFELNKHEAEIQKTGKAKKDDERRRSHSTDQGSNRVHLLPNKAPLAPAETKHRSHFPIWE